jgi:hypothetical protein
MDTGATDHLTNELGHLDTLEPYHGSNKVHTAKAPMEQVCIYFILVKHVTSVVMPLGLLNFAIFFEFPL